MNTSSREKLSINFLLSSQETTSVETLEPPQTQNSAFYTVQRETLQNLPTGESSFNGEGAEEDQNEKGEEEGKEEETQEGGEGVLVDYHNFDLEATISNFLQPVEPSLLKLRLQTFEGVVNNHILELRVSDRSYAKYACPFRCGKMVKGRGNYARHLNSHVKSVTNSFMDSYRKLNSNYQASSDLRWSWPQSQHFLVDPKISFLPPQDLNRKT